MTIDYSGTNEVNPYQELDFGLELIVNLYDVDPDKIRSRRTIEEYADKLVKLIDMKAYGAPLVPHFGHDNPDTSGYTLVQLIETSSITAHFSEGKNAAYFNVFSCQAFDPMVAMRFTAEYFGAKSCKYRVIPR